MGKGFFTYSTVGCITVEKQVIVKQNVSCYNRIKIRIPNQR